MKTFLSSIAATILVSNTVAAQQEPSSTAKRLVFVADCDKTDNVIKELITVYGEKAIVQGAGAVGLPNGEQLQGYTIITGNSETASYSITLNFDDGYTCILMYGNEIAPFSPEQQ